MADQQGPGRHHPDEGGILERSAQQQQQLRQHILAKGDEYKGKPWALVAEIERFANEVRLPMIFRSEKIATSKTSLAAVQPKPKVMVEFGTFVGTSAIAWAAMLRDFHGPEGAADVKVFTFEFDPQVAEVARALVRAVGFEDVIEVHVGPGAESLRRLHAAGKVTAGGVDAVFIDHFEQYYLPDLRLCEELGLFHPGSVVLADNTDMPGAPDYLAHVRKGGEGPVKYESQSVASTATHGPTVVEVSTVVAV